MALRVCIERNRSVPTHVADYLMDVAFPVWNTSSNPMTTTLRTWYAFVGNTHGRLFTGPYRPCDLFHA